MRGRAIQGWCPLPRRASQAEEVASGATREPMGMYVEVLAHGAGRDQGMLGPYAGNEHPGMLPGDSPLAMLRDCRTTLLVVWCL